MDYQFTDSILHAFSTPYSVLFRILSKGREGRKYKCTVFKERYMMAHGCKVMVRGRVWEEDVPPPVQSMKPKLLQSSKVHGGL